jgi:multisubunit Na+/H+ antiporter MnhF subunit
MNEWEVVAAVLAAIVIPCLAVAVLAGVTDALAALELAGTLMSAALMALCEGIHRQPFVDLALLFAVLSMVGVLVFARLIESDL